MPSYASLRTSLERSACPTILAALTALGCSDAGHRLGGETDTEPRAVSEGEAPARPAGGIGLCAEGADLELVDDMEDGNGALARHADRFGVWFSFHDRTGGEQFPAPDAATFVMSPLEPPERNSLLAARSHGKNFSEWGAGIGFELSLQDPYDLSRFAGVTFRAKREPESTASVRFAVTDVATTPRAGVCFEKDKGPPSSPTMPPCDAYFGAEVQLGTTFERYSYLWSELTQEAWAVPPLPSLDTTQSYGMRFQVGPSSDFDFWIDDVALICRRD
jgi:hypothetical protein